RRRAYRSADRPRVLLQGPARGGAARAVGAVGGAVRLRRGAVRMTSLRDLVELVRAPAALSVPGDALAGAAAAGVLRPRTAGLSAASVCLYWAGMAANDWADRELDAKERPERPIPSGRVSPGTAVGGAAGLTAAGLALAGLAGGKRALAVAVPLAGVGGGYDTGAKNTAAGPAVTGAAVAAAAPLGRRLAKRLSPT